MEDLKNCGIYLLGFFFGVPLFMMVVGAVHWFLYLALRVAMLLMFAVVFLVLLAAPVFMFLVLLGKTREKLQFVVGISGCAALMCGYYALFYHFQRSYLPLNVTPERFLTFMLSGR